MRIQPGINSAGCQHSKTNYFHSFSFSAISLSFSLYQPRSNRIYFSREPFLPFVFSSITFRFPEPSKHSSVRSILRISHSVWVYPRRMNEGSNGSLSRIHHDVRSGERQSIHFRLDVRLQQLTLARDLIDFFTPQERRDLESERK